MKYFGSLSVLALALVLSPSVQAVDFYAGVKGGSAMVDRQEDHVAVTFNTGEKSFTAVGVAKRNSLVLDHYLDGSSSNPDSEHDNPGISVNFVGSLAHVSVSKKSPWYASGIGGGYQKLDYQNIVSGISALNAKFAQLVRQMDDAFEHLMKTGNVAEQESLKAQQEKWRDDSGKEVLAYIQQESGIKTVSLSQKIEHAYTALIQERIRFLKDAVGQKEKGATNPVQSAMTGNGDAMVWNGSD